MPSLLHFLTPSLMTATFCQNLHTILWAHLRLSEFYTRAIRKPGNLQTGQERFLVLPEHCSPEWWDGAVPWENGDLK